MIFHSSMALQVLHPILRMSIPGPLRGYKETLVLILNRPPLQEDAVCLFKVKFILLVVKQLQQLKPTQPSILRVISNVGSCPKRIYYTQPFSFSKKDNKLIIYVVSSWIWMKASFSFKNFGSTMDKIINFQVLFCILSVNFPVPTPSKNSIFSPKM